MKGLGLALVLVLAFGAALWRLSDDETTAPFPAPNRERPAQAVSSHRGGSLPTSATPARAPEIIERPREAFGHEQEQEVSLAQQSAKLETRFAGEAADARWASEATRTITEEMQKAVSRDARIERIECRASLCRAELATTSQDAANTFAETWVRQTTWPGAAMFAPDTSRPDAPRLIVYLARQGTGLASVD